MYKLLSNLIIIWIIYIICDYILVDKSSFKKIVNIMFYLIGLVMILEYVVIIIIGILNYYYRI
ncbi:hypothetical protein EDC18_11225 [Natranaerovirga pectinivora]|uniref:Uncharacterized protein n=1 Tax=Natranaerovirga pectinivora TaxID=682400 RepID=A0A4R3MIF7_9FIRM|nr:hypothetical protein EDC18_11225 [Natranaerovirga pectinivora]